MVAYILYFNFTIDTVELWNSPLIEKIFADCCRNAGLIIMRICIRKYFIDLSGINVFLKKKIEVDCDAWS